MNDNLKTDIVCWCKSVTRATIEAAIRDGAASLRDVQRMDATRLGGRQQQCLQIVCEQRGPLFCGCRLGHRDAAAQRDGARDQEVLMRPLLRHDEGKRRRSIGSRLLLIVG